MDHRLGFGVFLARIIPMASICRPCKFSTIWS